MTTINRITQEDIDAFDMFSYANDYQHIATKSAIYPGIGTMWGISYCAHKLAGEAGEFNEHFGKAMRDDGLFDAHIDFQGFDESSLDPQFTAYRVRVRPLTDERRAYLLKELGDCLWYISALCRELGTTIGTVMLMNLRKLKDRTDRNTLQGDGDNR